MAAFTITIGKNEYRVEPSAENRYSGKINGEEYSADVSGSDTRFHLLLNHKSYRVEIIKADEENKKLWLRINGRKYQAELSDEYDALLKEMGMSGKIKAVKDLKAPMPGMVLDVLVNTGDKIAKDQPLIVLEAMKMENVLKSPAELTVKEIKVLKKNTVDKNEVLILFE